MNINLTSDELLTLVEVLGRRAKDIEGTEPPHRFRYMEEQLKQINTIMRKIAKEADK